MSADDVSQVFQIDLPTAGPEQFRDAVMNSRFFFCRALQFPERPGEIHFVYYSSRVVQDWSEPTIVGIVITHQTGPIGLHLSIHVRHDKFIEPFNNWLQEEYGASLIPKTENETNIHKHELLNCNRWLIDQYFNQGNTNYKKLVEEWLRIRKQKDYKEPPNNPIASMRTVIYENKEGKGIGA